MTAPRDGSQILQALVLTGQCLPEAEELSEFVQACNREESISPIFHPYAFQRARKRLPAMKKMASAAIKFRAAFEEFREAVLEEGDPELDGPALDLLRAEQERMGQ